MRDLPFVLTGDQTIYEAIGDWVGDIFYDILPEKGFDVRDEQIFMAFQLEKAFKEKKTILAEAGVGTGKTLAYLVYSLAYARYTGKPAIIACADETLIEQLVKKEGDIRKLEDSLALTIDVRLAKSREQYLCLNKLDTARFDSERIEAVYDSLPSFVHQQSSMLEYFPYGDRKDFGDLNDVEWQSIGWDPLQDCGSCPKRNKCGQTIHREHYRKAADIIVCSHDFYMEHIWTKESRKREGQLPLLPIASSVVFDEGHLVEFAAQKALSYKITDQTLELVLERLTVNGVRENSLLLIEEIIQFSQDFFDLLWKNSAAHDSEKRSISKTHDLVSTGKKLKYLVDQLTEELVFEGELFVIPEYELRLVEEYLEQFLYSMNLFVNDTSSIIWLEDNDEKTTLVIMPQMVNEVLKDELFSEKQPIIFSSATLSNGKDFSYIAKSLGIIDYLSFSVSSPFDYEEQMKIFIKEGNEMSRFDNIREDLIRNNGQSLILFPSVEEMKRFKQYIGHLSSTPFSIVFEGDKEISLLVDQFQNETSTVLCSYNLWEGLDIPGEALQHVIIANLPFPGNDPVFNAKRKLAHDAFSEIDLPYMGLRLRQGIGRLIRSHHDSGTVSIYHNEKNKHVLELIESLLPVTPEK
ncbi:ATP-dependent helicase [Bacillus coahuilensis m2-6]|nr:ATP-dependent helicase [Bacillus coahuilensis m2-6]